MGKLTVAVQETGVSRHNGGPIKGPPQYDSAVMYKRTHMNPRHVSLSVSFYLTENTLNSTTSNEHCTSTHLTARRFKQLCAACLQITSLAKDVGHR